MNYYCGIRLLLSGDIIIVSHDIVDGCGWLSRRRVRISEEARELCFSLCLKEILYSQNSIDPLSIDANILTKDFLKFCGFASMKKLDENCKLVAVSGTQDGDIEFIPTKYEENHEFAHAPSLSVKANIGASDLLEKLHKSFSLSVGSAKWNTAM